MGVIACKMNVSDKKMLDKKQETPKGLQLAGHLPKHTRWMTGKIQATKC